MKRLSVLFFIFVLIFSACATTPKSNIKTLHPQENPELYGRIQRIGERLLPVMDEENRAKYRVAVLDTPEVNAFADEKKNGGQIFILDKLGMFFIGFWYGPPVTNSI